MRPRESVINSKERKLLKKIPEELSEVLNGVSARWRLLSFKTGGPGWSAEIEINNRKFHLGSEYRYISVEEILKGSFRGVLPPDDLRKKISPAQVASLINDEVG